MLNSLQTQRVFALLSVVLIAGCYHDNEEDLAPCRITPGTVSYNTVKGLFSHYGCYGCHLGNSPEGGISLEQHASVKALVDNGRLLGAITHAAGFAPMPQAAAQMNECDITRIRAWIDAGAHDH